MDVLVERISLERVCWAVTMDESSGGIELLLDEKMDPPPCLFEDRDLSSSVDVSRCSYLYFGNVCYHQSWPQLLLGLEAQKFAVVSILPLPFAASAALRL